MPVIWVQHSDEELVRESPDWQLVPELVPEDGELRIHKQFNSSFEQTNLEDELGKIGATHIALAGAATNWCVRATAYGALERGYDLTLIGDAHTTESMDRADGTTIHAADVIDELNAVMRWGVLPWQDKRRRSGGGRRLHEARRRAVAADRAARGRLRDEP